MRATRRARGTRPCGGVRGAGALAVLAMATAVVGCSPADRQPADRSAAVSMPARGTPSAQARDLVLITIDTLRADRVGAYGYAAARTPHADALSARGVRFERAFAPAPITLTSHASLLTGLDPPGHGARHNGMRIRENVRTLAEILREQGWATGAFVGAFPLDRRFGLDRGFQVYGDRLPRGPDGRPLNERPGKAVVDEALEWLASAQAERLFVWVHLFEPHAPYEADPVSGLKGSTRTASDRYDDEVARADREVGRLLEGLRTRLGSAIVVLAGDHGEAFGEHQEIGHSVFVYDTTLRTPLIIAGAGIDRPGLVVREPVSLVDLVPTVLELLGLPQPDVDGASLAGAMAGRALQRGELYAESFAPLLDFAWSPLRSVRSGDWKYIAAPRPELYDVERDPAEQRNLVGAEPALARDLASRVERHSPADVSGSDPDDPALVAGDARARLQALGYLSGSGRSRPGPLPDPKDRRALAMRIGQVMSGELKGAALQSALEAIVTEEPANGQARLRLGYVHLDAGRCDKAEPHFRAAIAARLPTADPYIGLATCLGARGDVAEASRVLVEAAKVEPGNPVVGANLGIAALALGRLEEAITALSAALEVSPDLHQARFNLAVAYARAGRREDAGREARVLLGRLPAGAPQRTEVERLLQSVR